MAAGVKEIDTVEDFSKLLKDAAGNLVVVHFAAPWAPQCKQMTDVMSELSKDNQLRQVHFVQIEAEKLAEVSEKNNIIAVPTFIFFKSGKSVDRLDGANAADLTKKVRTLSVGNMAAAPPPPTQKQDLNTRLKQLINSAPVILFMKGSPKEPRCGFSRQITQILNDKNVSYSTFDILSDEEVRQGLKTYSNWPTYPQLYANGELLGGLDIVKELVESGELESQLPVKVKLEDRLSMEESMESPSHSQAPPILCCQDSADRLNAEQDDSDTESYSELDTSPANATEDFGYGELEDMNIEGFTVSMNDPEDDDDDLGEDDDESLPLWFSSDLSDTSEKPAHGKEKGRGRGVRKKSLDTRRYNQKMIQRERREYIRSDPSLLAAQREKERLRQMMIRRRDSLILSLPVDPNMSIHDANLMLMEQQREAGVPEEDITTLQIGRENFSTIGELKRKIEGKRALDRERTRMKRSQLDEELREEMKRACRDRMREKRARLREFDPAAAAAHREREKIRKRIERRRNAMLLSLPQEAIVPPIEGGEGESSLPMLPIPLAPEFSNAILVLRENLLRKRMEQKERVRRKRAELREKHPDVAAAIRERERVRKRIERRRNSLLLKLSPEDLLKATQSAMAHDSSSGSEASQSLIDFGMGVTLGNIQHQMDLLDNPHVTSTPIPLSSEVMSDESSTLSSVNASHSFNATSEAVTAAFEGDAEWASNIDKLKRSIQNKKDYNKERMRHKRAKLKEDPQAFEAMKERERVRKKLERLKKKGTNLLEMLNTPMTFNYDSPRGEPSSTATLSDSHPVKTTGTGQDSGQDSGQTTEVEDEVVVKQEPLEEESDEYAELDKTSQPQNHQPDPPQDVSRMKEVYTGAGGSPSDAPADLNRTESIVQDTEQSGVIYDRLSPISKSSEVCNESSSSIDNSKTSVKVEPDVDCESDESNEDSRDWKVENSNSEMWSIQDNFSLQRRSFLQGNMEELASEKYTNDRNKLQDKDAFPNADVSKSSSCYLQPPQQQVNSWSPQIQQYQGSNLVQSGTSGTTGPVLDPKEELDHSSSAMDQNKMTDGSTGPVDIPSFSTVEEERDWFQTQLCRLQTRVSDTVPPEDSNSNHQPVQSAPHGLCNTNYISMNSPSMASFGCYNTSVGHFSVNPFSDIAKLTSNPPPSTLQSNDYISGIAEVTLRSSLEQVTALAGPEVMQDRLRQMVESAKNSREKANDQARRRREKLRKDPTMKQKYEEIKAKDMERKRQQRAKEAEIRTVFPAFNEDRRVKDRERKKMNRARSKEEGVNSEVNSPGPGPAPAPAPAPAPTISQLLNQRMMMPSAFPVPQGMMLPPFRGATQNFLPSLYGSYGFPAQSGGLPFTQIRPPYIPQLGPQDSQSSVQTDIKPYISQNHSLAS